MAKLHHILLILAPCLGLAINTLTHIVLMRLAGWGMLKAVFAAFFIGLTSTLALTILASSGSLGVDSWAIATNLTIFGALGYCYFHFINMGTTGRRFRIMFELKNTPQGLTLDEIKARYNSSEMIDNRIRRLIDNHQAIRVDGRYHLTPSLMKGIALCYFLGKQLVFGGRNLAESREKE